MYRLFNRVLPFLLIVSGILWLVLGGKTLRNHFAFPQTTAVITDIQAEYDPARSQTDYDVFVRFSVDGSSYEAELGTYASNYKIGKEIKISYNPADPSEIQTAGIGTSVLLLFGGIAITAGGAVMLLKRLRGTASVV